MVYGIRGREEERRLRMEAMGGGERGVDGSYIMTLEKSEKLSPRRGDVSGKNLKLVTGQTSTCSCNHKAVTVKTGAPKLLNGDQQGWSKTNNQA